MDNLIRIEELAMLIGVSTKTIRTWYRFKRENPDDEYAKLLPEPILSGCLQWNREDVWKVIEFKQKLPRGRTGRMGSVTQIYDPNNFRNKQ